MIEVFCPRHASRVLLTARQIERIEDHPHGLTVHWRCWCGTRGGLRTGRNDTRPHADADALPAA